MTPKPDRPMGCHGLDTTAGCCVRITIGHAAAPPSPAMNEHRRGITAGGAGGPPHGPPEPTCTSYS